MSLIAILYAAAIFVADTWGLPSCLKLVPSVSLVLAADPRASFHP